MWRKHLCQRYEKTLGSNAMHTWRSRHECIPNKYRKRKYMNIRILILHLLYLRIRILIEIYGRRQQTTNKGSGMALINCVVFFTRKNVNGKDFVLKEGCRVSLPQTQGEDVSGFSFRVIIIILIILFIFDSFRNDPWERNYQFCHPLQNRMSPLLIKSRKGRKRNASFFLDIFFRSEQVRN